MDVNTMIYNILKDLITLIATVGLGFLTMYVKSHFSAKQMQTAQSVAAMAVQFAQQIGLPNNDKYLAALDQAKSFAKQYGINYTDEQWRGLIESSVIMAKKNWTDVSTTPSIQTEPSVDNSSLPPVSDTVQPIPVVPNQIQVVEPTQPVQEQSVPVESTLTQPQQ